MLHQITKTQRQIKYYEDTITSIFCNDPLGVIEDALMCKAGVIRDLTQCVDAKYIIFVSEDFESSIAEYQQYNVLNSSRKRRNLTR